MDDPSRQWDKFLAIFTAAQASCIPVKLVKASKTRYALPLDRKSLAKIKKKTDYGKDSWKLRMEIYTRSTVG